jgi:hypothetical protein
MNKKILPVTYPPITTYTGYADAIAILCSHTESLDWVYSHYIQIQVNDIINRVNNPDDLMLFAPFTASFFNDFDTRKTINAVCDNIFLGTERCPFFNVFEIPNTYVKAIDEKFCDFIKRTIDDGMYIYGYFDQSKISNYGSDFEIGHQILIFGYDYNNQRIHFADFLYGGKFTFEQCKFTEMEQAFCNIDNIFLPIVKSVALIQFIDYGAYTFDYSYVQDSVREYIYPDIKTEERQNNYTMSIFKPVNWITKTYMGTNVYDYFPIFIERENELKKDNIDHRLFHAMCDHKEMMIKRLCHFLETGYINNDKIPQIELYTKVRDNVLIVRNIILKYNLINVIGKIEKIKTLLAETKELEIKLLKEIFDV